MYAPPDISQLPEIAKLFRVSVDRLLGFHLESYASEVKRVLEEADYCEDTFREIEILSEGLKKYPSSDELKISLAFSLSMINRMPDVTEKDKKTAVNRAIALCREVIATCGYEKDINHAFTMMSRIYSETGRYEKAIESARRMSADRFQNRIMCIAKAIATRGNISELSAFVEKSLFNCWWAMAEIMDFHENSIAAAGCIEEAESFHNVHKKLLTLFDDECSDFFVSFKLVEREKAAQLYMKSSKREKCLSSLREFVELCRLVPGVAASESLNIADRCGFFRILKTRILRRSISAVFVRRLRSENMPDSSETIRSSPHCVTWQKKFEVLTGDIPENESTPFTGCFLFQFHLTSTT